MQKHPIPNIDDERTRLSSAATGLQVMLAIVGFSALLGALWLGWNNSDELRSFTASYLVSYMSFLGISLGGLFFAALQHLTRAGWSVTVRRTAEIISASMPCMVLLFLPILVPLLLGMTGPYYKWLDPELVAESSLLQWKKPYLNLPFFFARAAIYFLTWVLLARFYYKNSTRQDVEGGPELTRRMEKVAPVALILFGLTVTFAAFDWIMSLEPTWFSTIFGLYYFAGSVIAALAAMILFAIALQCRGYVAGAITVEHYHELGKLMLGFVIFWGYMAFSQYMLIWYANIPEESAWYLQRQSGSWMWVGLGLLFGHLILPFLGLLPRAVKRSKILLGAWAVWMLVIHWIDIYWLVMPTFAEDHLPFGAMDACCIIAIGSLMLAAIVKIARKCELIPTKDPRLEEALSFENF
ncbi:MAG: quinol:cytochrome C oxidoreductase [Pirellulales bacterium]|nr:quinol:cytochrome C oxidoreductase [Pirellulales bacterium]